MTSAKALSPGSNGLTLILLLLLTSFVVFYQWAPRALSLSGLIATCSLLALNFLIAIAKRKILVNKPALLVFHICLIVFFAELIISQLTYLKGTVEVGTHQQFDGQIENIKAGPLHDYQLGDKRFTNLGFQIYYHEGISRDNTINRIRIDDESGRGRIVEIGDHIPLVIGHYRFYTSHNKGYAPIFTWIPDEKNTALRGSVHLPAYPVNEYQQSREWNIPGTRHPLWTMLIIEEDIMPENRDFSFSIPYRHHLIMRSGEQRWKMQPGDRMKLPGGTLRYDELGSWMGYTVDYDWTRPWLLATSLLGILSIAFHYVSSFSANKLSFSGIER